MTLAGSVAHDHAGHLLVLAAASVAFAVLLRVERRRAGVGGRTGRVRRALRALRDRLRRPARRFADWLPEGRELPRETWRRRHRVIVRLCGVQAVGLTALALILGYGATVALVVAVLTTAPLVPALTPRLGRKLRASAATVALSLGAIVLVHLSGGLTEAHFYFFIIVGVAALYQDWTPFGVAVVLTVAHHGVMGTLAPHDVYGTPQAWQHPWLWAAIHGGFVLAASLANIAAWRLNEEQGVRDALTGLANRVRAAETLTRLLTDGGEACAVVVDLDDFKAVNDAGGHATGDRLLTAVADRLPACLPAGGLAARLGGDEFALLVPGPLGTGRMVADRVLRALAAPLHLDGTELVVRASVGVADSTSVGSPTADDLLRAADLAMYLSKASGKNRVTVFASGMDEQAREQAVLTEELGHALERGQLEVHYQPTVELDGGEAIGTEALLRWRHPERGLVPPGRFVPLAEGSGAVVAIGAWVLHTAAAQAVAWSAQAGRPVRVAVNLSARQLADPGFVAEVQRTLAETGLPADLLTLEITESLLVHDTDAVAQRLSRLRALGVRIAIDDFGTGWSSLSYLRRLPVDVLKVDRSFVADLATSAQAVALVRSILALADSLGLEVVAEGVETEEQAAALRALGCGHAQGFLFARPVPAADLAWEPVRPVAGPLAAVAD